jgi:hypothetical protein
MAALNHKRLLLGVTAGALMSVSLTLAASEMRGLSVIPTPERMPRGAVAVKTVQPVPRELVEAAARRTVAAWNTSHMGEVLHDDLFDKQRLLDAMDTAVPRDAKMRLLSVGGIQTLQQYAMWHKSRRWVLVSRVSATLRTQVEYNDPSGGFKRTPYTDEFVFEFRQAVGRPRKK